MADAELSFQELVSEHHELDERLRQFSNLAYLTGDQQYEESFLKKRKLALKDRIEALRRGQTPATA
jgi:uncharacterized protein YdcH (DUF465 family)